MSFLPIVVLLIGVILAGCPASPGTCNNNISGTSNVATCGGAGDGAQTVETTPAPIVPPVVINNPPASEPSE